MLCRIIFLLLITFIIQPCTSAIVIVIHGSFATLSTWYKPQGEFFNILEQQAQLFNHKVIPFSWSGVPTDAEIVRGGQALAKVILSYPPTEEIILIGHSNGGNVIIAASHLLHQACFDALPSQECTFVDSIITMPMQSTNNSYGLFDYLPTLRSRKKAHEILRKAVAEAIADVQVCASDYKKRLSEKSNSFILEKVYVLGTPVEQKKYYPNMHIINKFINLYSLGDLIQPVFGLYKRSYPLHERITNLSVLLDGSGTFILPNKPAHHELHHPLIGQWILGIPELLQAQNIGNFEQFSFNQNGSLLFKKNQVPVYQVHAKTKSLRFLPQALL